MSFADRFPRLSRSLEEKVREEEEAKLEGALLVHPRVGHSRSETCVDAGSSTTSLQFYEPHRCLETQGNEIRSMRTCRK